jgi:metallophosphoesterase (TIGR03767 family)
VSKFNTQDQIITRGVADSKGWRNLEFSVGEPLDEDSLDSTGEALLTLIHISDLHICDAQSPARVELMDRFADPHHPMSELVKLVGAYRAQEIMTAQTLEALIQTINRIDHGSTSKRPVDAVVVTGDVTDNAQANELDWYLTLMDGGTVHPDSGSHDEWEGVAQQRKETYDRSYWNPEGTPLDCEDDYPRSLYGFPAIPELTKAVRAPFTATGLKHPWFATHGNHDALLQGTVPPDVVLESFATGSQRLVGLAPDVDLSAMFGNFTQVGPTSYPQAEGGEFRETTPDPRRRFNKSDSWAKIHQSCGHGHGLTQENVLRGTKYWFQDIGSVRLISIDTVNINGGWQGSIDESQFEWLKKVLRAPEPSYFIILSHHPAATLFNLYAHEGADRRVGEEELVTELLKHPRIALWLAGHNHEHNIEFIGDSEVNGFWHIQTASNIDWPQQGRIVELVRDGEDLKIITTVFDHESPITLEDATADLSSPINIAGLSRILSANHWQRRSGEFDLELGSGQKEDRNRVLTVKGRL